MPFVPLLLQTAQQPNLLMSVLPFVLIIVIFYFFIIRPQNKKQKETEKMISALKKGDKIVTIGGIHGIVVSTKEKTVIVKVDSGASIEFNRSAVAAVVVDKKAEKKAEKNAKTEELKSKSESDSKSELEPKSETESTEESSENK